MQLTDTQRSLLAHHDASIAAHRRCNKRAVCAPRVLVGRCLRRNVRYMRNVQLLMEPHNLLVHPCKLAIASCKHRLRRRLTLAQCLLCSYPSKLLRLAHPQLLCMRLPCL